MARNIKKGVTTNQIKKGMRVLMQNGMRATMGDNRRGNVRFITDCGPLKDSGDEYAHKILAVELKGKWVPVTHTPAQIKMRQRTELMDSLIRHYEKEGD